MSDHLEEFKDVMDKAHVEYKARRFNPVRSHCQEHEEEEFNILYAIEGASELYKRIIYNTNGYSSEFLSPVRNLLYLSLDLLEKYDTVLRNEESEVSE